jgi:hypothetical protein
MTEDELIADLSRLLREGLVAVDADQSDGSDADPSAAPRFALTARGRHVCHEDPAPGDEVA